MTTIESFLADLPKPLPSNIVKRLRWMARELALGCIEELWGKELYSDPNVEISNYLYSMRKTQEEMHGDSFVEILTNLRIYYECRMGNRARYYLGLLERWGYIDENYDIAKPAFDLLEDIEPYNVFISYRRLNSSALALLVLARLKEFNLVPFVDLALEAGGNWHADLEDRIEHCDYFIILLGKDTLSSPMTVKEVRWALKYGKAIIPIWHSGFDSTDEEWAGSDQDVKDAVQQTNAIIVQDESASGYNAAIVELLGRFGIMP